jgi:hypothetical protein
MKWLKKPYATSDRKEDAEDGRGKQPFADAQTDAFQQFQDSVDMAGVH